MKKYTLIFITILSFGMVKAQKLTKVWEVSALEAPESVIFYENTYFVSNVAGQPAEKNGKGYISKIDKEGKIEKQRWATGFNAPKGLGIYGKNLYVADIDVVAVVDINTGEIKQKYNAEGATFLNDIEISKDGTVYITDTFGGNAIYRIKDGAISLWLKNERLNYPNGLKIKEDKIFVATWGVVTDTETFGTEVPGVLLEVDLHTKDIKMLTKPTGNLDGLVAVDDYFIASDWVSGGLMSISKTGETSKIMPLNPGSADISYSKKKNVLLVAQMLEGTVTAYQFD